MRLARTLMTAAVALALGAAAAIAADDKKASDPGFNALDKNNDGSLTRAEARGNPDLSGKFKQAVRNNDGKLSRAEYLAAMTKKDLKTAKQKVGNAIERNKDRDAGTGSSRPSDQPAKP
jgi:Ca2+-binding EF-hand superfamily protein